MTCQLQMKSNSKCITANAIISKVHLRVCLSQVKIDFYILRHNRRAQSARPVKIPNLPHKCPMTGANLKACCVILDVNHYDSLLLHLKLLKKSLHRLKLVKAKRISNWPKPRLGKQR